MATSVVKEILGVFRSQNSFVWAFSIGLVLIMPDKADWSRTADLGRVYCFCTWNRCHGVLPA